MQREPRAKCARRQFEEAAVCVHGTEAMQPEWERILADKAEERFSKLDKILGERLGGP